MNRHLIALFCAASFLSVIPSAARAEIDLGLSGYFLGYGLYNNQDETTGDLRHSDFRKETVIDFEGESKLDNGLTVGVAVEMDVDRADGGGDDFIDTSFATFSGGFGQFFLGENDGIAAILQVEAPAADPYVDGIDPKINAFNMAELGGGVNIPDGLGYLQEPVGKAAKIGYTTPVLNGLQLGVSYAPSVDDADLASSAGAAPDNDLGQIDNGLEAAARYEQKWNDWSLILGTGISHAALETRDGIDTNIGSDERLSYNIGTQIGYGPLLVGGAYVHDNNAIAEDGDTSIWVAGLNYTLNDRLTLGLSYLDREDEANFAGVGNVDSDRITTGLAYEYAPGLVGRASLSRLDVDSATNGGQGTQLAVGTEIRF